jgi:uncharacterized membrane protein
VAEISGERREWEAEIVEQEPDRVIAWRSTSGTPAGGSTQGVSSRTATDAERAFR